jgi:F0F1-type ATP synthase membrane subunit c/vacuolar-type H+-ATPase subunit K
VTAVWLLVRGELRRRWRSWVVRGLLAGISVGLACAGIAGARRTERAVPHYAQVSHQPDAAVLPNDSAFDDGTRTQVAALPEVTALYPFQVAFLLRVEGPEGMDAPLPTAPASMRVGESPYVAGRAPDPARADEIAVNEQARDQFGLEVGSTFKLAQDPPSADFPFPAPPDSAQPIE